MISYYRFFELNRACQSLQLHFVFLLSKLLCQSTSFHSFRILLIQGVLAHGSANVILTIYHLIITGLLSAALAAYSTAWSFVMQLQCGMTQTAFRGCSAIACPCAASGSCSVADFAYGGCTECLAPAAPMCSEALKESNAYVLAFTVSQCSLALSLPLTLLLIYDLCILTLLSIMNYVLNPVSFLLLVRWMNSF